MSLRNITVTVVRCDVPDCKTTEIFVRPQVIQTSGWVEVYRLDDDGSQRKQQVCPAHAGKLNLADRWEAPVMKFSSEREEVIQAFKDAKILGTGERVERPTLYVEAAPRALKGDK